LTTGGHPTNAPGAGQAPEKAFDSSGLFSYFRFREFLKNASLLLPEHLPQLKTIR
jgi:hypothetical protein